MSDTIDSIIVTAFSHFARAVHIRMDYAQMARRRVMAVKGFLLRAEMDPDLHLLIHPLPPHIPDLDFFRQAFLIRCVTDGDLEGEGGSCRRSCGIVGDSPIAPMV